MKIGPKSGPRNFEIHAFHEIILGFKITNFRDYQISFYTHRKSNDIEDANS